LNDEQQESRFRKFFAARKRPVIIVGVILLIGVGVLVYWILSLGKESTDDAQVAGHLVPISPRIAGHVVQINVNDNQLVDKGYLLVRLDSKEYKDRVRKSSAAVDAAIAQESASNRQVSVVGKTAPSSRNQAEAAVKSAQASVSSANNQVIAAIAQSRSATAQARASRDVVDAARTDVDAAVAQVDAAEAAVKASQANATSAAAQAKKAASDYARYKELYAAGAASAQQFESFQTTNTSAQAALNAARQQVASSKAALNRAGASLVGAKAILKRDNSQLAAAIDATDQAKAGVETAKSEAARARALLKQSQAALAGTQTVPEQISISKSQRGAARAAVKQSIAQLNNDRLLLSYTNIKAPVRGVVSEKGVQIGQYVQPGQMLMAVVPLTNVWVVANFKETQTGRMRPGQRATFTVDSYPGIRLRGRVNSIGAATVAQFSLLPSENATGNFVKVVQRIPVKIVLDQSLPKGVILRPGQNVIATVYLN
jgi:membrane fusion protein (multidrug efflux system)